MTLPVLTTREWRHICVGLVTSSIVIVTLLGYSTTDVASMMAPSLQWSMQTGAGSSVPYRAPGSKTFVYDNAGILTSDQAKRHQFDLNRLNDADIPVVIYIRRSDDSRNESVAYAERLRTDWALESTPGADDGIVILVSLSDTFRLRNSLVMSLGANALPIGQLRTDTLQEIYDEEMQPAFRRNEINLALSFGVRRILYYEGYTPPDPASLSGGQETARNLAPWPLLLAAIVGAAGVVPVGKWSRRLERRQLMRPSRRLRFLVLAALLVLSAALSLYGRNAPWLVASVLGAIVLVLAVRFASAWREWRRGGPRVSRVRSRGKRSRQPAILAHRNPRGLRNV